MKTSEAVAIIHRGIYREKDAISAYIKFAKAVKDPKAKNVLLNLADDAKILEIAVQREIVANKFYLDLAAKEKSPEAKEMFLSLAKEEELHMKILQAEIDSIGQSGFWFDMEELPMEK